MPGPPDRSSRLLRVVVGLLSISVVARAEIVRVNPRDTTTVPPRQYRPGFFYNNTTAQANAIFDAAPYFCNCLRGGDIAYRLRTSTSHASFVNWVVILRSLFEHRAQRTSRMIVEVSGMPYWLSSSSDTHQTGSGWRYYQTVAPRDINAWDSLMRDMASEISRWNFTPYYEFWNEPDLHDFWNGTEQELINLYIHTAKVIKSVDPDARVGAFAVNGWRRGIGTPNYNVWGYYPDSLAEMSSSTAHLIDSCAATATPLDFVTWHFFSFFVKDIEFGASFFRRKLDGHGMTGTEQIITEYNNLRETSRQPPLFVRYYNYIARAGVDAHTMAALQDFSYNPTYEFFGDYGSMSRGALCKPVYNAILLIDEVQRNGNLIPVYPETSITTLASRGGDELRLLIANYVNVPLHAGYERLFWDIHHVNTIDLSNAGYTRWGEIDSTIMGYYPPLGPPEVVAAFEDANRVYEWALVYYYTPRSLEIRFTGLVGPTNGTLCLIDAAHNNIIYRYDSLIGEGYTRQQAVDLLYPDQVLRYDSIQVADSTYALELPPNGIALLTLRGLNTEVAEPGPGDDIIGRWTVQNPRRRSSRLALPNGLQDFELSIYDVMGRRLFRTARRADREIRMPDLSTGVYYVALEAKDRTRIQKLVVIR